VSVLRVVGAIPVVRRLAGIAVFLYGVVRLRGLDGRGGASE
jgi:hypothetical protein